MDTGDATAMDAGKDGIMKGKAEWSTAYVNDLPDSAFLYIAPGGKKDGEGKTVPRSLRYFPVRDADGSVDGPHVRNALSRIPQASIPQEAKDRAIAAARRLFSELSKVDKGEDGSDDGGGDDGGSGGDDTSSTPADNFDWPNDLNDESAKLTWGRDGESSNADAE